MKISKTRSIRLNDKYENMLKIVKQGFERKGEKVSDNQIFMNGLEIQYLKEAEKCNSTFEMLMMLNIRRIVNEKYINGNDLEIAIEQMFFRLIYTVLDDNREDEDEFSLFQDIFNSALEGRQYYDCEKLNEKEGIDHNNKLVVKQQSLWQGMYLYEFLREFRLNKSIELSQFLLKFDILQEAYDLTMQK